MDEGCKKTLFAPGKEGAAKLLMEGKGLSMEEKYQAPDQLFVGTFALITMNTLPRVLKVKKPKGENDDEALEREAFLNRCAIFPMTITHDSKI